MLDDGCVLISLLLQLHVPPTTIVDILDREGGSVLGILAKLVAGYRLAPELYGSQNEENEDPHLVDRIELGLPAEGPSIKPKIAGYKRRASFHEVMNQAIEEPKKD